MNQATFRESLSRIQKPTLGYATANTARRMNDPDRFFAALPNTITCSDRCVVDARVAVLESRTAHRETVSPAMVLLEMLQGAAPEKLATRRESNNK
jgi:hypothetical protein